MTAHSAVVKVMRITFVLPPVDLSGGIRVVATYAQRLQENGHKVVLVSTPHRKPTLREQARRLMKGIPPPAEARPGPSHVDGLGVEHRVLRTARPIRASDVPDADVVIATWWETAEWVSEFPASKGAKVYFIQHHEVFPGQPAERVDATWRLPMQKICVAQWLADLARDRFDDAEAITVPNSVDLRQFAAPPREKQAAPTVGVMYSAAQFKGCDVSLAAYDLARDKLPALRLVSFGATREPSARLPLPVGADYFPEPPQDQIPRIYAACDAWLFGSRFEGFGLPILEAMACRTPVVATPAGAAPELLSEGGGRLVAMNDPASMAAGIVEICQLPAPAWRQMSNKAHEIASRYTWDDAAHAFEAALRQAVERTRRGAPAAA